MSNDQLLVSDASAACSHSTSASTSCVSLSPSPSASSSGGHSLGSAGTEWRGASSSRRRKSRKSRRGGQRRCERDGEGVIVKKMVKNEREKTRVRVVRHGYEELCAVLGDRVERGSGHFSKVRTLTAAIRRIEDLVERVVVGRLPGSSPAEEPSPSSSLSDAPEVRRLPIPTVADDMSPTPSFMHRAILSSYHCRLYFPPHRAIPST